MSRTISTTIEYLDVSTQPGTLWLAFHRGTLCTLKFCGGRSNIWQVIQKRFGYRVPVRRIAGDNATAEALRAYFGGDLGALGDVQVDPGGTEFQRRVWQELRLIQPGATVSYSELAARIGAPRATRAVARANATNPIAIVIPCHRVIGAAGDLRGYGGGIERKAWLLGHEGALKSDGGE